MNFDAMVYVLEVHKHPSYKFSPSSSGLEACELLYLQHNTFRVLLLFKDGFLPLAEQNLSVLLHVVHLIQSLNLYTHYIVSIDSTIILILLSNKYSLNSHPQQALYYVLNISSEENSHTISDNLGLRVSSQVASNGLTVLGTHPGVVIENSKVQQICHNDFRTQVWSVHEQYSGHCVLSVLVTFVHKLFQLRHLAESSLVLFFSFIFSPFYFQIYHLSYNLFFCI